MKVLFSFPTSAAVSAVSGLTAVSAFSSAGTYLATYTPYNMYTGLSSIASGIGARNFYFNFPVINSSGTTSAGVYGYVAQDLDGVQVGGYFDTTSEVREILNNVNSNMLMAVLSGSQAVNTSINELVFYESTVDSSGYAADAYSSQILRFKLYDAYGQETSVNPAERKLYKSNLSTLKNSLITGASGTTI